VSDAAAGSIGPVVGGLLTSLSWRWIFVINLPIGIVAVLVTWKMIPNVRHDRTTGMRRLAAVSGSSLTALARALTGHPSPSVHRPPPPGESQAARKTRPFRIIRDDAAHGMSIRQIAGRRHVHRRMVRQALAEPAGPPPRKRASGQRRSPARSGRSWTNWPSSPAQSGRSGPR
jgi:Major Facilitator Superfamily